MVLRIEVIGVSTYDETAAAPGAAAAPPPEAFLTSASVTCPPVPVPLSPVILTPFSIANLTAAALAFGILSKADCSLPPLDSVSSGTGADSVFGGGAVSELVPAGSEDSLASSFGGVAGAFSPPASSSVNDSKAEASSPSAIMTAMGWKKWS